jgi:hypothetical protein
MGLSSAVKVQRYRERQRRDEVLVTICTNPIALADTLGAAGVSLADDDAESLARGLEQLLKNCKERSHDNLSAARWPRSITKPRRPDLQSPPQQKICDLIPNTSTVKSAFASPFTSA